MHQARAAQALALLLWHDGQVHETGAAVVYTLRVGAKNGEKTHIGQNWHLLQGLNPLHRVTGL